MTFKNLRKHLPKTKVDYMRHTAGRPALLSSGAAGAAAAAAAAATTTTAATVPWLATLVEAVLVAVVRN